MDWEGINCNENRKTYAIFSEHVDILPSGGKYRHLHECGTCDTESQALAIFNECNARDDGRYVIAVAVRPSGPWTECPLLHHETRGAIAFV